MLDAVGRARITQTCKKGSFPFTLPRHLRLDVVGIYGFESSRRRPSSSGGCFRRRVWSGFLPSRCFQACIPSLGRKRHFKYRRYSSVQTTDIWAITAPDERKASMGHQGHLNNSFEGLSLCFSRRFFAFWCLLRFLMVFSAATSAADFWDFIYTTSVYRSKNTEILLTLLNCACSAWGEKSCTLLASEVVDILR